MKQIARHFQWLRTSSLRGLAEIAAAPTILCMVVGKNFTNLEISHHTLKHRTCLEYFKASFK
jgi:hypothetical protein